jgi:hypothetical protein
MPVLQTAGPIIAITTGMSNLAVDALHGETKIMALDEAPDRWWKKGSRQVPVAKVLNALLSSGCPR